MASYLVGCFFSLRTHAALIQQHSPHPTATGRLPNHSGIHAHTSTAHSPSMSTSSLRLLPDAVMPPPSHHAALLRTAMSPTASPRGSNQRRPGGEATEGAHLPIGEAHLPASSGTARRVVHPMPKWLNVAILLAATVAFAVVGELLISALQVLFIPSQSVPSIRPP